MAKQINVFTSPSRFKTINGQSIIGTGNITISGGGGSITVDSAIDATSTNPVQNKVIATALNNKQTALVSGTNIKTINETSVLGSGDITIPTTSLDGKTGAITFEEVTPNTPEFVVNENNVIERNIHIYQHHITLTDGDSVAAFSLMHVTNEPFGTAQDIANYLNLVLGASANNGAAYEGIPASGVIALGGLSGHDYIYQIRGQDPATSPTTLLFGTMSTTGIKGTATVTISDSVKVKDKVLIII